MRRDKDKHDHTDCRPDYARLPCSPRALIQGMLWATPGLSRPNLSANLISEAGRAREHGALPGSPGAGARRSYGDSIREPNAISAKRHNSLTQCHNSVLSTIITNTVNGTGSSLRTITYRCSFSLEDEMQTASNCPQYRYCLEHRSSPNSKNTSGAHTFHTFHTCGSTCGKPTIPGYTARTT